MRTKIKRLRIQHFGWPLAVVLTLLQLSALAQSHDKDQELGTAAVPPEYVEAKAYYVLPETHNNQSGYFSLSEGLDGNLHIGTTAYGENAYLVEFDPRLETQRIVLDTNKVCGLDAKGFAAQAKLHTRNFVGRSGTVYVGSKQGYRLDENDTADYPGGYVMSYDPRNGRTENLGMPMPGQGVADVTADERRQLLYVVTCEEQHWMLSDLNGSSWHELGPILTPYAMTLVAADGQAYAITDDFKLAIYNPESKEISVRPILVDNKPWTRQNDHAIPTWVLTPDQKRAYVILLNDSTLLEIDLVDGGPTINHGKMIDGNNPDSRCGLDLGADGNVYAVIRIDNTTGFGTGFLHHLVRFLPASGAMQDLGVLSVTNPDYFDWEKKGPDGEPQKYTHGFHRLPDDTLTPLHAHMALKVAHDNTIYITVIYPFTLLRIDDYRIDQSPGMAEKVVMHAEQITYATEQKLDELTRVAEVLAERHIKGGLIGFPFFSQPIAQDLWGRSGGIMHIGFERSWKVERSEAEMANDIAIVAYEGDPGADDLEKLQQLKQKGVYLVGFGPEDLESLQNIVGICDAWFDANLKTESLHDAEGGVITTDLITSNAIQSTTLIAEFVGALTRDGKMPVIWKGYAYDDGRAWGEKYFQKIQFHQDYEVQSFNKGELGAKYLTQIRYPLRRLKGQGGALREAAGMIAAAMKNEQVYVAWQGHMPLAYVGKSEVDRWAQAVEFHPFLPTQVEAWRKTVPDNAFVLSLGYHGLDPVQADAWRAQNQRVIHLSGDHPDPDWKPAGDLLLSIDFGFAFGDACVSVEGYPICLFAPSGIAQRVAYTAILSELPKTNSDSKTDQTD